MAEIMYCVFMDVLGYKARVMNTSKTPDEIEQELKDIQTNIAVQFHFLVNEINRFYNNSPPIFIRSFSDSIYFECKTIEPLIIICHNVYNYVFGFFKNLPTTIEITPLLRCGIAKDWTTQFHDIAEIVYHKDGLNPIGLGVVKAYETSEKSGFSGMRIILSPEVFADLQCKKAKSEYFECYCKRLTVWNIPTNYLFKHLVRNREGKNVNYFELLWSYNSFESGDFSHIDVLKKLESTFKGEAIKHSMATAQLFYDSLLLTMWNRPKDERFAEQSSKLKQLIKSDCLLLLNRFFSKLINFRLCF